MRRHVNDLPLLDGTETATFDPDALCTITPRRHPLKYDVTVWYDEK